MLYWLLQQQKLQYAHDAQNHQDIHSLSRADRLKHYGLHYAKYCGRLARGDSAHPFHKTIVDCMLISLSASNTLQDNLAKAELVEAQTTRDAFQLVFFDAVGEFADGCEKMDHMENFHDLLISANRRIVQALISVSRMENVDLVQIIDARRIELHERVFYN